MEEGLKRARSIVGSSPGKPKDEFYPTPPDAVHALLSVWKPRYHHIWEPACGNGAISKVLVEHGYAPYSTDLYDHGYGVSGIDFLETVEAEEKVLITNPPFSLAQSFVEHAFELGMEQVALLLKLQFLEGQRRQPFFEKYPLKWVYVFSNRLKLTRNGLPYKNKGMMAFAWFVWDARPWGFGPGIKWINSLPWR